jgi:hypothetical protein
LRKKGCTVAAFFVAAFFNTAVFYCNTELLSSNLAKNFNSEITAIAWFHAEFHHNSRLLGGWTWCSGEQPSAKNEKNT